MKPKRIAVIGAGFGGLAASAYLAKAGFSVTVFEKNGWTGGRAQVWKGKTHTLDMGPSWYWMPEIINAYFRDFGSDCSAYYRLKRLSPSYRVYTDDGYVDLPDSTEGLMALFDRYEPGAGRKLGQMLEKTGAVYRLAMDHFVNKPSGSFLDIVSPSWIMNGIRLMGVYNGFMPVEAFYRRYFRNPTLLKLLSFPIFFLGESARSIPAVYAMMNHVDMVGGTWHPVGGFAKVAGAVADVARKQGAEIRLDSQVTRIVTDGNTATGIETENGSFHPADIVVSNGDYFRTENGLLPGSASSYPVKYWDKLKLAPSAFIMFLHLARKLPGLLHHTMFFHNNWEDHDDALFRHASWPKKPLYYVSVPSKTDPTLTGKNEDVMTILVPIASGLPDTPDHRHRLERYLLEDLERKIRFPLGKYVKSKRIYGPDDFSTDYHAYKGNAYGLAHTLTQTAFFRPKLRSGKIPNLFYTGQFTVPGIGVPMVLISGKLAAEEITRIYG